MIRVAAACAVCLLLSISARAEVNNASRQTGVTVEADPAEAMLETGFRQLYELNFQGAREQFLSYQKARPADPLGKAAEAASYLYEELNAKGVFTSEFFLNDSKLLSGVDGKPSANKNEPFMRANNEAREMAKR